MGKPRKIIIDDKIPCNKDGESLFPKCFNFEEFWPLILTKAILKLFSFKYKSSIFTKKCVGDIQLFYSLTGYIPEIINFEILRKISLKNNSNKDLLKNYINTNIHDDKFLHKKNFLMVFYNSNENDELNIENHLFKKTVAHKVKLGLSKRILFLESSIKKIALASNVQEKKKLQSKNFLLKIFLF